MRVIYAKYRQKIWQINAETVWKVHMVRCIDESSVCVCVIRLGGSSGVVVVVVQSDGCWHQIMPKTLHRGNG